MIDGDSEDEEERRKRIAAEENGSNIGAVLGIAIGAISALTQEEQDIHAQEEYNEYYVQEENWEQAM